MFGPRWMMKRNQNQIKQFHGSDCFAFDSLALDKQTNQDMTLTGVFCLLDLKTCCASPKTQSSPHTVSRGAGAALQTPGANSAAEKTRSGVGHCRSSHWESLFSKEKNVLGKAPQTSLRYRHFSLCKVLWKNSNHCRHRRSQSYQKNPRAYGIAIKLTSVVVIISAQA